MIYFLYSPYSQSLINNTGIPSPQITFEKIEFHNNQIIASIRNTGSTEIIISQMLTLMIEYKCSNRAIKNIAKTI